MRGLKRSYSTQLEVSLAHHFFEEEIEIRRTGKVLCKQKFPSKAGELRFMLCYVY